MGCMGHPAVQDATPNLDRLAETGTLFLNAYANSPLCVPSRASIWSGKYVYRCEAWNNFKGLESNRGTFETRLQDSGYTVKIFGKTDYLSGHHTERARVSAWTRTVNRKLLRPTHTVEAPRIIPGKLERVHERDWIDVDRCVEWLKHKASSAEKPFMLYLGIRAPHPPFVTSKEYLNLIDEDEVEVPPVDETSHPALEYARKVWVQRFEPTEENIRLIRRVYFAMISEVDRMVGRILDCLEEAGFKDSTYVIFTSDHGEHAMEHGLTHKHTAYEPSVRVPLIISGPKARRGAVVEDLVSLVDLYPTLTDIAGTPTPPGLDGYSLKPLLERGEDPKRPDWVFSEYHGEAAATSIFMVRRGPWKYVAYPDMPPQLFNLEEDPWETRNLASEAEDKAEEMEVLLKTIVDYREVYRKVEEYNRKTFMEWRKKHKEKGDYEMLMAKIFSGWEVPDSEVKPWTKEDEEIIKQWLGEI